MKQNRLICSRPRPLNTFLPPLERQCNSLRRFTVTREACLSLIRAHSSNAPGIGRANLRVCHRSSAIKHSHPGDVVTLHYKGAVSGCVPLIPSVVFQIDNSATLNYSGYMLRVYCKDVEMIKIKTKRPCELIETEEFSVSWTLLGDPSRADGRLDEVLHHIATEPESFPVVDWPNIRMALITDLDGSIGVFFRRIPDSQRIELLRSQVKNTN